MDISLFSNPTRKFVVTLFVEESAVKNTMGAIQKLGNQRNVILTVQPSPYEAVEFLYQISASLPGNYHSLEKELFWEAIEIKADTPADVVKKISDCHHDHLCNILEQKLDQLHAENTLFNEYQSYIILHK